jgi:hypothetical protein
MKSHFFQDCFLTFLKLPPQLFFQTRGLNAGLSPKSWRLATFGFWPKLKIGFFKSKNFFSFRAAKFHLKPKKLYLAIEKKC